MDRLKGLEGMSEREFRDRYMVLDEYEERKIEKVTNTIVDWLDYGGKLTTDNLLNFYMKDLCKSEEVIKAVHSLVQRKLLVRGKMLVVYPNINLTYSNYNNKVVDYHVYQAVPILVPTPFKWGDEE